MQTPQGYSSSAPSPYAGSGAASSMYMGVPPYSSSMFNGTSIPPYDVPFSGGSAYHYNYGTRMSGGSPYRPMHLSAPAPYSGGSMMGHGMCLFMYLYCCLLWSIFLTVLLLHKCIVEHTMFLLPINLPLLDAVNFLANN